MTVESDAFAAVTDDWQSAREIWQRVGAWSDITVASRLNLLSESGEIERSKVPLDGVGGFKYVYRKMPIG